jgi:hypothetical protein
MPKQHSEPTLPATTPPAQDTPHAEKAEPAHSPAAVDNPGGGGMDAFRPSVQPSATTQFYIQSHYTQTAAGTWTLDTTFLDTRLEAEGKICSPVDSRGDCGYEAIIKAGRLSVDFHTLKTETLTFVQANDRAIRSQFERAGGVTGSMDDFMLRIRHDLATDGVYANHHTLQLVAWKLERTIVIHDIFDFHQISLSGQ